MDTIIFGTGFAGNDFLAPMQVTGPDGLDLHRAWRDRGGAEAYLGITVSGFPNLFLIYGPNTNLGHNSIVYMLESQADYILGAVQYAERRGLRSLQVKPAVEEEYNRTLAHRLGNTVWNAGCQSWYISASGKNTNNWPGFTFEYRRRTRHFDPARYHMA